MKRILITGATGYIGTAFQAYLSKWPQDYQAELVSVTGDGWKQLDFSQYDAVYHVAGIAHRKETEENAALYYAVNRDLTVALAQKAKDSGVPHLVFMSSMSVYGMDAGTITPATQPCPTSHYGKSKLEAEQLLAQMEAPGFCVTTLRPPMVYGKGCKGNFQLLRKLVEKSPVFPAVQNRRSMISIANLCAFSKLVIDRQLAGVFCPQNQDYVNTTELARLMAAAMGRRVHFSPLAGLAVRMMMPLVSKARKAFSSLIYEGFPQPEEAYWVEDLADSVRASVK